MSETDFKDCRECEYHVMAYHRLQCIAEGMPKPVEWVRRPENNCGPEAVMFEKKEKK